MRCKVLPKGSPKVIPLLNKLFVPGFAWLPPGINEVNPSALRIHEYPVYLSYLVIWIILINKNLFLLPILLLFAISCSLGNKNKNGIFGKDSNQKRISDDSLLTLVQYRTFQYFWDGAEPNSGMARERFHVDGSENEKTLAAEIDKLWREVEWSWFTKGGEDVLYWHWSPEYGWDMNFPVRGYNECLILYILAASSPTYPIQAKAYHLGWAGNGAICTNSGEYGYSLALKHNVNEKYGGPLFWAHYSYLGLDPRFLKDKYADYWQENKNQTLINWNWCTLNPNKFAGYSSDCWGLTASYSISGYSAHCPGENNDLGVISPTAALSSFPYTPEQSMNALKHFYYVLGNKIWGEYGFYDAFSEQHNWYPQRYLAIDQGPAIIMIENYRTGLLWNLFMSSKEIQNGLNLLGFTTD